CLMDLSTLPCTSKYTTAMLNNISQNGKLFYLPGPTQIRGIVYNKTLFEENGWKVPTDFNGFIALCKSIEESGIRSLQLGLDNAEVLDTAFVGYGYDSSFSKPENAHKMLDYNNGIGSFADNFMPALKSFQTLIDSGVLQKADLNIDYADRERLLFSRQCAMVEDSVMFTHMGFDYNGCKDEFALMPFFNPGEDGRDWARLYPVCYIGASKKLTLPENKKKYDLVMDLLEYISTPEGQLTLIGNNGGMFSSLKDMPAPNIPEIKDLLPALEHGRYAIFPTLKNAQTALRNGLAGMVNGTLTASDVVKMVDQQNQNPAIPASTLILGSATDDFSLIETGSFLTDAMRKQSKSDIALFLDNGKDGTYNGKGINGRLYKGDLTPTDITRILPDLRYNEKGELWKITMTGENLINTLEYSIPVDNNHIGWFYYFSGLKMEFAPAATPGKRIRKITDDKDQPIDPKRLYSIAGMDETVPHEFIQSC
ncbi:MAG: extracellular solute-binding protein, partial [Oscillospiraceae bacterium]